MANNNMKPNDEMTVRQVVEATIEILKSINITMDMYDRIGTPVMHSIQNLQLCVNAWNQEEAMKQGFPELDLQIDEEQPENTETEQPEGGEA